jgi:hypothetical protein
MTSADVDVYSIGGVTGRAMCLRGAVHPDA